MPEPAAAYLAHAMRTLACRRVAASIGTHSHARRLSMGVAMGGPFLLPLAQTSHSDHNPM